ncbi:MAG: hypothetical protein ACPL3A_00825 [Thermoanaerobacteraceae bacterium]
MSDNIEDQLKEILKKFGIKEDMDDKKDEPEDNPDENDGSGKDGSNNDDSGKKNDGGDEKKQVKALTPSEIIVILGILAGTLEPISIIVDRNQGVQIILSGSLKKKILVEDEVKEIENEYLSSAIKALIAKNNI